ncbi:uncharacterized protein EV420DRAFT_1498792 [Desarmillaria tabescens]|uniref:Uncharacterized protein n=1 Tax=Armillaria tabescens TaxID=1929756 RepID=A0AA39TYN2_ARMTA|nr:uncharacterized protein EV420DRAFT_1498792 [Desarmillaria tabescens]KAK0470173.1 hypothetical protein EV420DRAFT_1498792 [Desarmillaria tabescens]
MSTSFCSFTSTTTTAPLPSYNKRLFPSSSTTTTISEGEPPYKKQRNMSSLRRTHSYLSLTDLPNQQQQSIYIAPTRGRCRGRKLSMAPPANADFRASLEASMALSLAPITDPYNTQQKRARPAPPAPVASTSTTTSSGSCATPSHPVYSSAPRVSSPLSPSSRPSSYTTPFSRPRKGKGEPDLHRIAIQTCMRSTTEGQKVLNMGPRIAMSIANATRELERIVTEQGMESRASDEDIVMRDSTAEPWVNVSRSDDWEMIHCGA